MDTPLLHYESAAETEESRRHRRLTLLLSISALTLSVLSFFVVWQGANDEPYVSFRTYDAIMQLGVGWPLIILWCFHTVAIITLVCRRKLPRAWLSLLLWTAICLFYLYNCPFGYIEDIHKFDPGALPF